jgi:hypothetical protein
MRESRSVRTLGWPIVLLLVDERAIAGLLRADDCREDFE